MTPRQWNLALLAVLVGAFAVFVGSLFLLTHLARVCDAVPTNSTRFDCSVGWVGVSLSVVSFGSFALPVKSPQVLQANVGPVVFQMYMSMAVLLTAPTVLIIVPWSFTWYGTASAALWVPTSLLSLVAIRFIGISVGQAMWAGATVIVSFVWGVAVFHETPSVLGLAMLGLVFILAGITGLSMCNSERIKNLEARRTSKRPASGAESLLPVGPDEELDPSKPLIQKEEPHSLTGSISGPKSLIIGILAALGTGLTNGSMLVPAHLASGLDKDYQGLGFIMSFSIGVALVTLAISIIYFLVTRQLPVLKPEKMLIPAFGTGVMWAIGNLGSIYAAQYLGLAVGFSLTQTCLIVAGIWAITALGELRGLIPVGLWTISALVVLGGAGLLSIYGH